MSIARQQANALLALLRREHHALADFLVAADFDRERRWEALGHASLFAKLCLSSVAELANVLTPENVSEVLPRYFHLSRSEAKEVTAALRPDPAPALRIVVTVVPPTTGTSATVTDVPGSDPSATRRGFLENLGHANPAVPDVVRPSVKSASLRAEVEPVTGDLRRLHLTVSHRLLEKLAAAKDALPHSHRNASDAEVLEVALDLVIERHRRRRGIGCRPRKRAQPGPVPAASATPALEPSPPSPPPPKRSRHVPAHVWRAVWARDGGKCAWPLEAGGVCGSTRRLELDHVDGFARGAPTTVEGCRFLCQPTSSSPRAGCTGTTSSTATWRPGLRGRSLAAALSPSRPTATWSWLRSSGEPQPGRLVAGVREGQAPRRSAPYVCAMRLHLVDGTYELFRAHFAPRPGHRAAAGWEAKATVGLVASLLSLLHDEAEGVTHVAIAFDNPIRSFRNDLFAGYKSDEGVPPELRAQFDAAENAVRALGLTVWSMREHEADDALATAAARFRGQVEQVRLLTPDKDLGQCLAGREVVMVDRMRKKEIDEAALLARRGIRPASVPDWLALVGDDADGIPGLPGFGEVTAARLLAAHGHLEAIPALAAGWPPGIRGAPQLAATLEAGREAALLYRRLATLVTDVPLAESLEDLRWRGLSRPRLEAWCAELAAPAVLASLDGRRARWEGETRQGG